VLSNSNELIGQVLGTCTLQRLLGRGGMGAVYLARQSRPRRRVAVKVILPGLIEEKTREEFLIRFRREADAIAALDHIHIMPIYEYSEQGDTAYLVMPYVMGGTLRDRLEKSPTLSLDESIHIIDQAAAGLDSAHAQGIIHRDLKPANMLFHADGRLLLADFGLAKVLKDVENSGLSLMTSAGTIIGTPEYLSPEQGTGNPLDVRTDIYSLGIVLYHMLAGRVPFTGTSPVAIAIKHAMVEPPPLRQFNPHIAPDVEAVVMKAIAKAPEERFSSAGELARTLRLAASEGQDHPWHRPSSEQKIGDDTAPYAVSTHAMQQTKEEVKSPLPEPLEGDARPQQVHKSPNMAGQERLPEHIAALPTMLIRSDDHQFHHAETEENSHLPQALVSNVPSASTPEAITMTDSLVNPNPIAIDSNLEPEIPAEQALLVEPLPLELHEKPAEHQYSKQELQARQFSDQASMQLPSSTTNRQPLRTVLMASFLILFILGGSLATYQHFKVTPSGQGATNTRPSHTPSEKKPTSTPTPSPQPSPIALPIPPSTVAHGAMIYGTASPSCDKQAGQWSTSPNASVTCTGDGTQITAQPNNAGLATGTFLEQLPNGAQMPNDFVIQAQIAVNPKSSGSFGIYFRSQSSDHQRSYLFLIDQASAQWTIYYYNPTANTYQALNTTPVPTLLSNPVQGTVTIDLLVQSNNYGVFINGTNLQGAETYTTWYPSGTIGLAVGQGASVTVKNVAIYAVQ
jgi:serine/threonine protein kinase